MYIMLNIMYYYELNSFLEELSYSVNFDSLTIIIYWLIKSVHFLVMAFLKYDF